MPSGLDFFAPSPETSPPPPPPPQQLPQTSSDIFNPSSSRSNIASEPYRQQKMPNNTSSHAPTIADPPETTPVPIQALVCTDTVYPSSIPLSPDFPYLLN